jgi:aldose 1-epimerase
LCRAFRLRLCISGVGDPGYNTGKNLRRAACPASFAAHSPAMKLPRHAPVLAFSLLAALVALPLPWLRAAATVAAVTPGVAKSVFAQMPDGSDIEAYTLTNQKGMTAKILTLGAIVAELNVPDRAGASVNVVKAVPTNAAQAMRGQTAAVQGRVANRIAGAKFTLDGKEYVLEANNAPNTLHSGSAAIAQLNWKADAPKPADGARVTLTVVSPDGAGGFPGTMTISVTYTLTDDNALVLDYRATTDKPSLVNLTNHAYFNLAGSGAVNAHELTLNAARHTASVNLIPTGELAPVAGTTLDFTKPLPLGHYAAQRNGQNYDDNFVINRDNLKDGELAFAARVTDPTSGRVMEVWTTEPGVQLYTSRLAAPPAPGAVPAAATPPVAPPAASTPPAGAAPVAGTPAATGPAGTPTVPGQPPGGAGFPGGRGGGRGGRGPGGNQAGFFCLETQHHPDSIHHENFPSIVLRPGQTFTSRTEWRFSAIK